MNSGVEVFTVDGHSVYQYNELHGGSMRLFVLKINNEDAAYVAHGYLTIYGHTYPYLTRAMTMPKFQGRGYALKIIIHLRNLYNTKMLSDQELTPDGIALWKQLAAVLPVKVFDFTNNTTLAINDVPAGELYTDIDRNKHVFIIEKLSALYDSQTTQQRIQEGIVKSYSSMVVEQDVWLASI